MNQENCRLIFTGKIVDGMTLERVQQNLAALYRADIEKIKKMFSEERRVVLKRDADRQTCLKMQKRLLNIGAVCDIESDETEDAGLKEDPAENAPAPPGQAGPAGNPYAAPLAPLQAASARESGDLIDPRRRPASRGASWFFRGVSLFLKSPFVWMLTMICFFLLGLVQFIPILGAIAMSLLGPVFFGGLILGAKNLDETGVLKVGYLFAGFRQGFGQLLLLGLLFLAAMVLGAVLSMGVIFVTLGVNPLNPQGEMITAGAPVTAFFLMPLLMLAVFVPVMMGYWFAPALIAINKKPVFEAIALSFRGCLKNILPFLIYSLIALGVMIGVMAALGLIVGLLAAGGGGPGLLTAIVPIILVAPLMLVLMPIYVASTYTSYKDVFYAH